MDRRYPIGHFQFEGEITPSQRESWIKEIEESPSRLKEAVNGLSEDQLNLTYREGGWTLRQVVHHIADSQINNLVRFKLALTEDTPTIKPYFEDRWAELPDAKADATFSVQLVEALNQRLVPLMKSMTDSDFKKQFFHPESQKHISLDYYLGFCSWHLRHHIAQITMLRKELKI